MRRSKVTIPNHKGDIAPGTLNSILKQAGLK
ncbi:MAG: type II toxin-antitoxin system HicA family toxin [Clostridiaceae bacterium]|nr:type II toxin-antitoxin system HicA family toxin [Clostridiaceae bacterium]